jgi:hypothetical protein
LTTALTVLFWVVIGANALFLLALLNQRAVGEDEYDELLPDLDRVDSADNAVAGAAIVLFLVTIAIAVLFIIWMWRAANNNDALGRRNPRLSDGWAIGGWFIPLANFVLPVLIMQDLWRGSDASVPREHPDWRRAAGSGLIGAWWGLLVASVVGRFVSRASANAAGEFESFSDYRAGNSVAVIATLFAIASGLLAIIVVRRLARRQERCLEVQRHAWQDRVPQGPPPAPA